MFATLWVKKYAAGDSSPGRLFVCNLLAIIAAILQIASTFFQFCNIFLFFCDIVVSGRWHNERICNTVEENYVFEGHKADSARRKKWKTERRSTRKRFFAFTLRTFTSKMNTKRLDADHFVGKTWKNFSTNMQSDVAVVRKISPLKTKENRIGKPKTAYLCGFQNGHKKQRITGIEPAFLSSDSRILMRFSVSGVENPWKTVFAILQQLTASSLTYTTITVASMGPPAPLAR